MPLWLAEAAGVAAFLKVTVWPLTFRVEPSSTRLLRVAPLVVRVTVMLAGPEPAELVRPSEFRTSAGPLRLRSAPDELFRVASPMFTKDAVWPALVTNA